MRLIPRASVLLPLLLAAITLPVNAADKTVILNGKSAGSVFEGIEKAVAADACNRAAPAKPEIEFALQNKAICRVLLAANLPGRVTHNDTKINNVLLDDATGEGVCVIDLDTVMATWCAR